MSETSNAPEIGRLALPVTLYPSKRPLIGYIAACLMFLAMAVGLLIVNGHDLWYWLGAIVPGVVLVGCIVQALPRAAYLDLNEQGFTYSYLFVQKTIPWRDVKRLFLQQLRGGWYLGWHLQSTGAKKRSPPDGILPDSYGLDPNELLALMSVVQQQISAAHAEPE